MSTASSEKSRREAPWHGPPRGGDHLSRGCRTRRPFLCRSGSADGIGALGAAAARSRCPYRTESLVPHRCRQRGRDHRRCAPRPGSATAPDPIGSRTGRCSHFGRRDHRSLPANICCHPRNRRGAADRFPYWRDVRMLHMPRVAATLPPQWSGIRLKTATMSSLARTTANPVHGSSGEDGLDPQTSFRNG